MRYLPVAAGVVLLAAASAAGPILRGQANQHSVYVSVVDQSGAPVPDLKPSDFIVREDKIAREVLTVAPAAEPMQLALLIDDSQAAESVISNYREALPLFVNTVMADGGPKHQVAVITYGERPTIAVDYTSDREAVLKATQRIFGKNGSAAYLLDALIETSRGFTKRAAARPVIVAVGTEGPDMSSRFYQEVLEPLRTSGAEFDVLIVGRPVNESHDRAIVLDQGTRQTGGRYENVLTANALPMRLKQVAVDLTHKYRVTYARPQTLIPPESVTVSMAKPGLTARGTERKESSPQGRP